jgi:hypothetical protein
MTLSKQFFSLLGAGIDIASILPYILGICRGRIKPHAFSWLIWVVLMAVGLYAQITDGAGVGTWVLATALATTSVVCILAWTKGERRGTRSDWCFLIGALGAIPLWLVVKSPVPSVILITIIDLLGYGPTMRKAWSKPEEEQVLMWALGTLKFCCALVALETYSLTTWLYPAAIALANAVLVTLLLYRRRVLV